MNARFIGVLLSLCALLPSAQAAERAAAPSEVVLEIPPSQPPQVVRLVLSVDGHSPDVPWLAFLERYFAHFDFDRSRSLSSAEAQRMIPWAGAGGGEPRPIRFDQLDADGDGRATIDEWKAYCLQLRLTAVTTAPEHPSAIDLRLGQLFAASLDADDDGQFTRAELSRAPRLLRRYDLNDDEFLEPEELLQLASLGQPSPASPQRLVAASQECLLHVNLGDGAAVALGPGDAGGFSLRQFAHGRFELLPPGREWIVIGSLTRTLPDLQSTREFLLAQLTTALGEQQALERSQLERDLSLSGLFELFEPADRNADSCLSPAELNEYLLLVESGLRSQTCVRLIDHAYNLFPLLDRDGDGRLSGAELAHADDALGGGVQHLPRIVSLLFGAPRVRRWGGIAIAAKQPPVPAAHLDGPRWFRSLDRNRDNFVSAREFLGRPEAFQRLDQSGDGVLDVEEATRAEGDLRNGRKMTSPQTSRPLRERQDEGSRKTGNYFPSVPNPTTGGMKQ